MSAQKSASATFALQVNPLPSKHRSHHVPRNPSIACGFGSEIVGIDDRLWGHDGPETIWDPNGRGLLCRILLRRLGTACSLRLGRCWNIENMVSRLGGRHFVSLESCLVVHVIYVRCRIVEWTAERGNRPMAIPKLSRPTVVGRHPLSTSIRLSSSLVTWCSARLKCCADQVH
jgi:hypothetical protein